MEYTFGDVWDVRTADGHLRSRIRKLRKPKRNVLYNILIGTTLGWMNNAVLIGCGLFPHAVQVVLPLRAVDGDADGKVFAVLLDEMLHCWCVVVDAVGGERETIAVEPVVVQFKHPQLQVVANLVNQFNLQEWLATNKVPYNTLFAKFILMPQHIVDKCLRRLPWHPLLNILSYQIAVLASQLAVLGDDEGDILISSFLPHSLVSFYFVNSHEVMFKIMIIIICRNR